MIESIKIIDKTNRVQYIFKPNSEIIKNNQKIYITNEVIKSKRVGRPLDKKSDYKHKLHQYKIKIDEFEKVYPTLVKASQDKDLLDKGINYTTLLNVSRGAIKKKWNNLKIEKINIK